jgi:hypothetical protein
LEKKIAGSKEKYTRGNPGKFTPKNKKEDLKHFVNRLNNLPGIETLT